MKIRYSKIFSTLAMLFVLAGFGSCKDDLILEEGSGSWADDGEGGFVIGLGNTRGGFDGGHTSMIAGDGEETVINENNFHVILFDSKGAVIEEWANQEISKIKEFSDEFGDWRTKYFVRIPRRRIKESTIQRMRTEQFKIAVFANWSDYPDFTYTKWEEKQTNGIDKNNLFYISHSQLDPSYGNNASVDGEIEDSEVFEFITGHGSRMGVSQEWVCDRFASDQEADDAIRAKYELNDDGTGKFYSDAAVTLRNASGASVPYQMDPYTYYDVWNIWNFGGERNYREGDQTYYKTSNNEIGKKWASLNNDWKELCFNETGATNGNEKVPDGTTVRGLSVHTPSSMAVQGQNWDDGSQKHYGLQLKDTKRGTSIKEILVDEGSYLQCKIPADGYMYVKCRAQSAGAKLVFRRGKLNSTQAIYQRDFSPATDKVDVVTLDYTQYGNQMIRITGEPEDFVMYATGGVVEIYEIDYIKSRMIQSVDRQMILPTHTPEGGISMYGIQDFEPAGLDVWPDGTTFNFSRYESTHTGVNASKYKYRSISLLRSVSKVEIYVPKSIFPKPSHMYLRTINRFSRSAPVDIFTPTNIIWDGWENSTGYSDGTVKGWNMDMTGELDHHYNLAPGIDDEAEHIRQYGFTYKYYSDTPSNEVLRAEYRNAVSWLFGLWEAEFGWNWGDQNVTIDPNKPRPYPRVFNTRIARSDYAHMLYGGEVDGCYYYYAYLPEKNITDPNDKGTLNDAPKVMRVEMRFGDRNSDVNLDDNASYRIYFMPGGKGEGVTDRDSYDGVLESGLKKEDVGNEDQSVQLQNLHKMYPIMRNHLYRFKITGIDMNGLKVNFDVKGADTRDITYTFD